MAAVLQGRVSISRQQQLANVVAVSFFQHAPYSSDIRPIKKPALSQMRKGAGGRSSFNGVIATVFGSTGFVGRNVISELGKHGTQLVLPYRGDPYDIRDLKLAGDLGQVLFHPFHLLDEDSIRQAVKYSNVVINLVGRNYETKNFTFDDVFNHGARRLARISREMGVEKFIHMSSLNVSPNPSPKMILGGSGILKAKYRGEQAVREEFPEAVILRPSIIYGREDHWLSHHRHSLRRNGHSIALYKKGFGISKMPIYVTDVAAAIYEIIKNPDSAGKTYQAVGPHRYTLHDLMLWIMNTMRMGEEDGFTITDLRFSPLQIAKIVALSLLPGKPIANLHWELLENEATTDEIDYFHPTLLELGIEPTPLEENLPWVLKHAKHRAYIASMVGDIDKVIPPKPVD